MRSPRTGPVSQHAGPVRSAASSSSPLGPFQPHDTRAPLCLCQPGPAGQPRPLPPDPRSRNVCARNPRRSGRGFPSSTALCDPRRPPLIGPVRPSPLPLPHCLPSLAPRSTAAIARRAEERFAADFAAASAAPAAPIHPPASPEPAASDHQVQKPRGIPWRRLRERRPPRLLILADEPSAGHLRSIQTPGERHPTLPLLLR